ncbi:MAG: hypothetical protein KJ077_08260 [Anaerolineae bacterium]|nr:hypothetical protein [Anaerolineae bacterium]
MKKWIGLGFGLSFGAGLVWLLATDEVFRLAVLAILAFLLGVGLVLGLVWIIGRQHTESQRNVLEAVRPQALNYSNRHTVPTQPFYPVVPNVIQQLPGPDFTGGQIINGDSSEVVG